MKELTLVLLVVQIIVIALIIFCEIHRYYEEKRFSKRLSSLVELSVFNLEEFIREDKND